MYELTLLERMEALESDRHETGEKNPVEIETQSIMAHLRKLLNTNKGSVQIDPEYGMPDMMAFSGAGIDEAMEKIQKAIQDVIQKYEKRLSNVKIKIEPDKKDVLTIQFHLEAVLARHSNVPVLLHSFVKPGGKISISR